MESKADFKVHDDEIVLVVDKWLSLGDGMDPHAKSWQRHEYCGIASDSVQVGFDQTETMRKFETLATRTLAEHTRENEERATCHSKNISP